MDDIPVKEVKAYRKAMLEYFEENEKDIVTEIVESKDLQDDLKNMILKAADDFRKIYDSNK